MVRCVNRANKDLSAMVWSDDRSIMRAVKRQKKSAQKKPGSCLIFLSASASPRLAYTDDTAVAAADAGKHRTTGSSKRAAIGGFNFDLNVRVYRSMHHEFMREQDGVRAVSSKARAVPELFRGLTDSDGTHKKKRVARSGFKSKGK
jgi:hypothetical protein